MSETNAYRCVQIKQLHAIACKCMQKHANASKSMQMHANACNCREDKYQDKYKYKDKDEYKDNDNYKYKSFGM